ncbi:hypothetical protein SODALDRAFT_65836 [Sodiomyces alkalinus F11]|uniref:Uncharacterized protein n=1 Tax=Sodiomyces alkalinus (strain CBS 110278 / VKM F-3762 / F11) TaxID=1314773 RepID=A0A3N2PLN2_SODAK|nr:hypothetical protein SODALDRAFT_65836 [Sodiomyces alkalinus F11]ROT35428.1 hypothetical protein SODALDRAFT_65836 [Sodiomyces alkalinus F11]
MLLHRLAPQAVLGPSASCLDSVLTGFVSCLIHIFLHRSVEAPRRQLYRLRAVESRRYQQCHLHSSTSGHVSSPTTSRLSCPPSSTSLDLSRPVQAFCGVLILPAFDDQFPRVWAQQGSSNAT